MNLHNAGEVVKAVAPALSAGATLWAASIAYRSLEKWRSETLGKRKAELAEQVLASAYEMQEILRSSRDLYVPLSAFENEAVAKDVHQVVEARLQENQEFFGRFRSLSFSFAAVFGRDSASHLDALWDCRVEIRAAVDELTMLKPKRTKSFEDSAREKALLEIIHRYPGHDDFATRVASHIRALERICRPAIEARSRG